MRRLIPLLVSGLLAGSLLAVSATVVMAAACTTTCYVNVATGNDANDGDTPATAKKTINAAIAQVSPGGTVIVASGVYPEFVLINKSITLQGPNSNVSCLGPRSTEAVITGDAGDTGAVRILADNVTFTGFQVSDTMNGLGSGIHADSSNSGYRVWNNLITDNQIGMYADSDGASWVSCNIFDGNNNPGSAGGAAIYSDSSVDLTIDRNRIINHNINFPVYIDFLAATPAAMVHDNLTFSRNWMDNFWSGAMFHALDGGSITWNDIRAPDATLIGIEGNSQNVKVTYNVLHNGERGVRIEDVGIGPNSNIDVNRNSFTDLNSNGILNAPGGHTGVVDGTCNWWGSATGPGPVGPGTGEGVSADVDFKPWLVSNDLDSFCGPDLTIDKFHLLPFKQLIPGKWFIVVRNVGGGDTNGPVVVQDTAQNGIRLLMMSGLGWQCRMSDWSCEWLGGPVAPGGTYPPITVKGYVTLNAGNPVYNGATVSGGGDQNVQLNNGDTDRTDVFRWLFWFV